MAQILDDLSIFAQRAARRHPLIWQEKCLTDLYPMMRHAAASEPLIESIGGNQASLNASVERRRSPRATLHWTLYLRCSGGVSPVRTEAINISRDGFYCLLNHPIRPGERIQCDIVVPTHSSQDPGDVVYLRCSAQAVRVEKVRTGAEFGLACRVDNYCILRDIRKGSGIQNARELY